MVGRPAQTTMQTVGVDVFRPSYLIIFCVACLSKSPSFPAMACSVDRPRSQLKVVMVGVASGGDGGGVKGFFGGDGGGSQHLRRARGTDPERATRQHGRTEGSWWRGGGAEEEEVYGHRAREMES